MLLDELRFVWWWRSPLAYLDDNGELASATSVRRTSDTSGEEWMGRPVLTLLRQLESRFGRDFDIEQDRFEPWQVVRYRRGQQFDEHHDAGFFGTSPSGERTHSFVVYLEDHPRGGAIVFPRLKQRYRPQAGRILVWRNLLEDGSVDPRMRHKALPALRTKIALTTWARQRPIRPQSPKESSAWRH